MKHKKRFFACVCKFNLIAFENCKQSKKHVVYFLTIRENFHVTFLHLIFGNSKARQQG